MSQSIDECLTPIMSGEPLIRSMNKDEVTVAVKELPMENTEETPMKPFHIVSRTASISSIQEKDHKMEGGAKVGRSDILSLVTEALQAVKSSSAMASFFNHGKTNSTYSKNTSATEITESDWQRFGAPPPECVDTMDTPMVHGPHPQARECAHEGSVSQAMLAMPPKFSDAANTETRQVPPNPMARMNSKHFEVAEGDSVPRKSKRKMDRNAMANPGASSHIPRSS